MTYLSMMEERTGFLPAESVRELGKELADRYRIADPFPSIVLDDFLPAALAEAMLHHFGASGLTSDTMTFDKAEERYKSSFHPDTTDDFARAVFYSFNSRPFIRVLENITGITGLIPDPYFLGAGFHEIRTGGHLSIHADFNHHRPLNLERRINVLIYLNKDWDEGYGGQLELWNSDMTQRVQSIVPHFNRCVIFNTTSNSMHGNPSIVNHPNGKSRKSIALYYYTSTWDATRRSHTTQFKPRLNSKDKVNWSTKLTEAMDELLPPLLRRQISRFSRAVRRTINR